MASPLETIVRTCSQLFNDTVEQLCATLVMEGCELSDLGLESHRGADPRLSLTVRGQPVYVVRERFDGRNYTVEVQPAGELKDAIISSNTVMENWNG